MLRGGGRRKSGGVGSEQSEVWIQKPRCFVHFVSKSKVRCLFARQLVVILKVKRLSTQHSVLRLRSSGMEPEVVMLRSGRVRDQDRFVISSSKQASHMFGMSESSSNFWPRHDVYKERGLNEDTSSRLPHRLARPFLTTMLGICTTRSLPRPARNEF